MGFQHSLLGSLRVLYAIEKLIFLTFEGPEKYRKLLVFF